MYAIYIYSLMIFLNIIKYYVRPKLFFKSDFLLLNKK